MTAPVFWSEIYDACQHFIQTFNTDDEDGQFVKLAIDQLRDTLRRYDDQEAAQPAPQEPRLFRPGDIVRNKRTREQLTVSEDGIWSPEHYEPVAPQEPRPLRRFTDMDNDTWWELAPGRFWYGHSEIRARAEREYAPNGDRTLQQIKDRFGPVTEVLSDTPNGRA